MRADSIVEYLGALEEERSAFLKEGFKSRQVQFCRVCVNLSEVRVNRGVERDA